MNNENLKIILEENGMKTEKIDEIINALGEVGSSQRQDDPVNEERKELLTKYDEAKDWRTKAILAARIISNGLDT